MKYLGLDIGQKTIGIAVGETLAAELMTLRASKDQSFYEGSAQEKSFEQITQLLESEGASGIVVGLPVKEDGSHSAESKKISQYADKLEQWLGMAVHRVDETLTSFMARDILESQGADAAEIEERIDQLSAQLILQQYLEEHASP